jgi:hypothetical protein
MVTCFRYSIVTRAHEPRQCYLTPHVTSAFQTWPIRTPARHRRGGRWCLVRPTNMQHGSTRLRTAGLVPLIVTVARTGSGPPAGSLTGSACSDLGASDCMLCGQAGAPSTQMMQAVPVTNMVMRNVLPSVAFLSSVVLAAFVAYHGPHCPGLRGFHEWWPAGIQHALNQNHAVPCHDNVTECGISVGVFVAVVAYHCLKFRFRVTYRMDNGSTSLTAATLGWLAILRSLGGRRMSMPTASAPTVTPCSQTAHRVKRTTAPGVGTITGPMIATTHPLYTRLLLRYAGPLFLK